MRRGKHPLTVTLRVPPLPLPGGEETLIANAAVLRTWAPLPPAGGEVVRRTGEGVPLALRPPC